MTNGRAMKTRENGTAYPFLFTDLVPRQKDDTGWCLCITVSREPHLLGSISQIQTLWSSGSVKKASLAFSSSGIKCELG